MSAPSSSSTTEELQASSISLYMMQIYDWCKEHFVTIAIIAYMLIKLKLNSRPIVELEGSKVVDIKDGFDWDKLFSQAKQDNSRVICCFYNVSKTVRLDAPVFSQLSMKYRKMNVIFVKVDCDICKDLALRNEIKVYPTYIFFDSDAKRLNVITDTNQAGKWTIFEEFALQSGVKEPISNNNSINSDNSNSSNRFNSSNSNSNSSSINGTSNKKND